MGWPYIARSLSLKLTHDDSWRWTSEALVPQWPLKAGEVMAGAGEVAVVAWAVA
jgi:hypothetical protein